MPNNGNSNYSYSNLAPGFPNDGVSINHGNSYNAHRRPDLSGAPRTFSSQGGRGPILLPLPSNPPIIHPINPPIIPPINLPIIPPINPPINQMQAPIAARSTVPPTGWAPQPGQVSCPQPAAPQQRIAQTPHNTQWIPYEVREPKALTRPRVMTREENDCLVGIFNKHGRHMNAYVLHSFAP